MASFIEMWSEYKNSTSHATYKRQLGHFSKWEAYIKDIRIGDVWLRSFDTADKNFIMAGFAQRIRKNCYGTIKNKKVLVAGTVESTIGSISTSFRENSLMNPALDENNEKCIFLQRQFRSYRNQDPPPDGQQCLPLQVFIDIHGDQSSKFQTALGQLTAGALFFACRSCKYS